MNLIKMMNE
ncbi:Protein of unknown function [Bacillus cereus]|nr:Protein of unknown function [Bacillus cereus]